MIYKQLCALTLTVLAAVSWAATKPNFSGDWQLNLAKSNYGQMPPPTSMVRTITHADPSLEIVDDRNSDRGTRVSSRKYMTSGQTTTFEVNGAPVEGSAVWDGDSLVVTTKVSSVGLVFKDKMSLSADGKQLTSDVQIDSQRGPAQVKLVFDRQAP
jgi:hypothetical protein